MAVSSEKNPFGSHRELTNSSTRQSNEGSSAPSAEAVAVDIDQNSRAFMEERGSHTQQEINERLSRLLDQAPSDATGELEIRKNAKGYQALLKIFSRQGKFIGGSRGSKLTEVVERIFEEVHDQIKAWKRERDSKSIEA